MEIQRYWTLMPCSPFRSPPTALRVVSIALLILFTAAAHAPAQDTSVTLSAAEFQRQVYAAHLHTELTLKPELEASLQVLLELQRHNPHADPVALTGVLTNALQRYRAMAPDYVRSNGFRDEVLAAYLQCLRQVPWRPNFVPVNLTLLSDFMLGPGDYANGSPAGLMHSANQRLFASKDDAIKRQSLVDDCVARAQGNAGFAAALNRFLWPETGVSLEDSPAAIIGSTNSPLHDSPTLQTLLALSQASGDGSLTISTNQVMSLFTDEMQTIWDTVQTNLAVRAQINQSQPDLLSYLTNQAAIDANVQLVVSVQQGQPARLASATAAMLVQSHLLPVNTDSDESEKIAKSACAGAKIGAGIASLCFGNPSGLGLLLSGGMETFDLFGDGQSAQDEMADQISNIQTLMGDLSTNMNYRFDRVDQSLTTIFDTMNQQFGLITNYLDGQGRQIAELTGDVNAIRSSLVDVQTDLDRLERHLATYVTQLYNRGLNEAFNTYLGYEATHPGQMLTADHYNYHAEPKFFTLARDNSVDGLSCPHLDRDYTPAGLEAELTESGDGATNRLDQNLGYIKKYLQDVLGQTTAGTLGQGTLHPVANPRDWFVGAFAYAQLALENPTYFRRVNLTNRLDLITARGRDLTSFLGSLSFSGTNVNWPLYGALQNHYASNLISFNAQVSALEGAYATNHSFAVGTWRRCNEAAPRGAATATELVSVPESWNSPSTGQSFTAPAGLTNVVAIAAGFGNDIALKADGTVVTWGDNQYGQTNVPSGLSNVVAVSAGDGHYLALKEDGTVVGWGWNDYGQATGVPHGSPGAVTILGRPLTNVVAIAAGDAFSLALKADGTVIEWGDVSNPGPTGASNVVAISANSFPAALKSDGTVVGLGWYHPPPALSSVVAIAAGSEAFLALNADGTVFGEGPDVEELPSGMSNVVAIATGREFGNNHALALKIDGTVVAWGNNTYGQISIPVGFSNVVAIAAGYKHSLFLRALPASGPAASGNLSFVRAQIPARVPALFESCNQNTVTELGLTGSDLAIAAGSLSGTRALLEAVLELGMSYTLANDDILHGSLYGKEPLVGTSAAVTFLQEQNAQLQADPDTPPHALTEVAALRYLRFQERLNQCLTNLQTSGQPETPRLAGHTLRLLDLLRDAWTQPTNSPPPALEIWGENNSPRLVLYAEPYQRYTLQYRDDLGVAGWTGTTITNLGNEQVISPPSSGTSQRFYRAVLPLP